MGKLKSFRDFLKQTRSELRKVRWLKRKELVSHTITVIVFCLVSVLFFAGVDALIAQAFSLFK